MLVRMSTIARTIDTPLGARQLARGITATWWYTVSAVLMFELLFVAMWTLTAVGADPAMSTTLAIGAGGFVWLLATTFLLAAYRYERDVHSPVPRAQIVVPIAIAAVYGATAGVLAGSWLLGVTPVVQALALLNWPAGIRARVVAFATLALLCLAFVDGVGATSLVGNEWVALALSVVLPAMTVSSLWWWDVLVVLDRARASEARLAATQERLRVATDVHDLQGHHLQVIALQLELAERLHTADPDAALAQLQAARRSVDDARQGTRDLATRFRSVPLSDELANARDLLSAAGLTVEARIDPEADLAPATDLGPVIRETTTNVLRHGGGHRARLALVRSEGGWRYEIANDAAHDSGDASPSGSGSGLDGIRRRIAAANGTLEIRRGDEFAVVVTVPDEETDAR